MTTFFNSLNSFNFEILTLDVYLLETLFWGASISSNRNDSISSVAERSTSVRACEYTSKVVLVLEWPNLLLTLFIFTPSAINIVALVCLRPCKGTSSGNLIDFLNSVGWGKLARPLYCNGKKII